MAVMGGQGHGWIGSSASAVRPPSQAARSRAAAGALVLAITAAAAAGCGTARSGAAGATPAPSEGGFGWFAYGDSNAAGASEPGTPVDAVERAGLRLSEHANMQQVATQSVSGLAESYLFVFQAGAAAAAGICSQDGLGGLRAVPADRMVLSVNMGSPPVTAGSRWCEGTSPTDPRWTRRVLIDAGDPATVHLLLQRTGPVPDGATPPAAQ
jgi:hypothetical protein